MSHPTPANVAAEVRAEMARQGITAAGLSEATGISRASLSRKLRSGSLTLPEAIRVAEVLRVPLAELIRRAELTVVAA